MFLAEHSARWLLYVRSFVLAVYRVWLAVSSSAGVRRAFVGIGWSPIVGKCPPSNRQIFDKDGDVVSPSGSPE